MKDWRNEEILKSIINGTQYTDPPQSRIEDLLLQVKQVIEQGGEITIDSELSNSSINPVQNRIISAALAEKANTSDVQTEISTAINSALEALVIIQTEA